MVLQYPWESSEKSRAVLGCSVSASWSHAKIGSDSFANEAAYSLNEPFGNVGSIDSTDWPEIRNNLDASSPNAHRYHRLISIQNRWFDSLAPSTSNEDHENATHSLSTVERLFSDVGLSREMIMQRTQPHFMYDSQEDLCYFGVPLSPNTDTTILNDVTCGNGGKHLLMELIIAATFANGLSRYGSHRAFEPESLGQNNSFQWKLKPLSRAPNYDASLLSLKPGDNAILSAPLDSDFVTLRMRVEVGGYAWYASGISYYLATVVVVLYMLIALSYTVWVLCTGVTSSSWDTVTELLALALQSPVPQTLKGSGAGVERMGTYKKLVRVAALNRQEHGQRAEPPRLGLVIDDIHNGEIETDESRERREASFTHIEIDKKYL